MPRDCAQVHSVIFDLDGVIIDSHPVHRKAWQQFLCTLGKNVSDHELNFILDGRKRRDILRHFLGEMSEEQLAEYGRQKDHFFRQKAFEVKPLRGVTDFIEHLRGQGVTLAIATSASKSRTNSTLQRLNLWHHFAAVVTGDDVPEGKPHPAAYRVVCSKLQTDARWSIALEDAVSGIRSAKEAGLRCIGVGCSSGGAKLRAAGADMVIEDFTGLSLARLNGILNPDVGVARGNGEHIAAATNP